MTNSRELTSLAELAQLTLDHRLGVLRDKLDQLDQSRMQLSAINQVAHPVDLDPILSSKVVVNYGRWADSRRGELNLVIARQTAAWLEARSAAKTAFGRVQALQELAEKRAK